MPDLTQSSQKVNFKMNKSLALYKRVSIFFFYIYLKYKHSLLKYALFRILEALSAYLLKITK